MNIDEQIEEARVAVKEAREAIRKDGVDKYDIKGCNATYKELLESQRHSLLQLVRILSSVEINHSNMFW